MTTTYSASVSVLQVGDASVWQDGFADEHGKRAFGLYASKRRTPEQLRHKTSALHKSRISSSPSVSISPGAAFGFKDKDREPAPPNSLNRRRGELRGVASPTYEPPTPSLPPSQSLASFLSGQKSDGLEEEEERQRLKREERFASQRASLRPSRSISQSQPVQRSSEGKGKEKDAVNSWRHGTVEMMAHGSGGIYGGALRISGEKGIASRQINLAPLHKLKSDSTPSPIKDIRLLHPSLTTQEYVLSLTLILDLSTSNSSSERHLGQLPQSLYDEDRNQQGSSSSSINRRPSTAGTGTSRKFAAISKRARGLTSAGTAENEVESGGRKGSASSGSVNVSSTPGGPYGGPSGIGSMGGTVGQEVQQTFLLSFTTMAERWEWYTLLLSLCPPPKAARQQRSLAVKILDLQERLPNGPAQGRGEEASLHLGPSVDTRSVRGREGKEKVKSGWGQRERICCEVVLDGAPYGRTSWQAAEERSFSPFWGESIDLNDLPDFGTCTIKLYRLHKHRPILFATVDIPVMSSYTKQRDERYPIMSDSTVIGELRLVAEYQDFVVLPRENYAGLSIRAHGRRRSADEQLTRCDHGLDLVYALANKGTLDGLSDLLVRIGIASGTLLEWLENMCRFEAQASGETLFRGNTLLSKTLEATMRSFCHDFLVRSIGPTIDRVLTEGLALSLHVTTQANGLVVLQDESLEGMRELVRDCWEDMYRMLMLEMLFQSMFAGLFVRHVLFHLFKAVKEHHAADGEKLKFKAVSSFLFLRLIGPALMRPHLFGLADGMPSPGVRKTLTLLAKVLHALAFFTEKDGRDPELACFTHFIKDNAEAMMDYLSSLTTPLDRSYRTPTPSAIGCLIAERVARAPLHLAERTPILTAAGPLDLSADLAVLYHTLSERRQASRHVANSSSAPPVLTRQEQDLNRILDKIADNTEAARMRKLSITSSYRGSIGSTTDSGYVTARGRPSLSLSIESGSTPPMPGRLPDEEAQMRRKSSAASGMSSYKTPRLAVQTPLTGSTVPTVLETPTSQHSHSTKVAVPSSPLVPSSPTSPTPKSPILGATNTFRNKLSASASWRWLSFGGAASVATDKQAHVTVNPHEIARPTKMDLNGTTKTVMGNDPARNDTSPGSSRTRVTIQPNRSTPISAQKHAAGSPSPSPSPSPVRKARSASAAPSRHARSGSLSLPASPGLPREASYTSSRSGSSHHSTTLSGTSAVAARSAATSLAYRQHSYPFLGDQARPTMQHSHYSDRDRSPAYAREPQMQYSSPPSREYHSPATAPSTATTPSFPSLPHSHSQTSSSVSSNQSQTSRGTGVGVSAAPKQRLAIAPSALLRAAEMEDLLKAKPRRPDRHRERPATANLSSKGLEAELGEVVERRGGRLKRSGTLGGSSRSAR